MRILIFGTTGMLGHVLFDDLKRNNFEVYGTQRKSDSNPNSNIVYFDVFESDKKSTLALIEKIKPSVIINCVGIIKQLKDAKDKAKSIRINALWPHILGEIGAELGIKVIHFSTDCVFSGSKGSYKETDAPDATDIYGVTKFLGEIEYKNSLTLRTSIIGHELSTSYSLVDWFMSQEGKCRGYTKAIYTGFPTIVVSKVLQKYVFPNPQLEGLYHLASHSISKYDLLKLMAKHYQKNIEIIPDESVKIDRSLDGTKFNLATGFNPPSWEELVADMYAHFVKYEKLK